MSKQVPEGRKNSLSRDEQLEQLRKKLLGNQVFGRCRGRLGKGTMPTIEDMVVQSESPTQFCATWDAFASDARVMGNLLAQYFRDGWDDAYLALNHALRDKNFVLPGEEVPLEALKSRTIIMLDPERTLLMLNWLLKERPDDLATWLRRKDGRDIDRDPSTRTEQLFEQFKKLEAHVRDSVNSNECHGYDLYSTYRDDVFKKFDPVSRLKDSGACRALSLLDGQWDTVGIDDRYIPKFAFVYEGPQDEVLKHFTREEQNSIATWHVRIPNALQGFYLGIHKESEHARWAKEFPSLVSKGVSHGYGTVVFTDSPTKDVALSELYKTTRVRRSTQDSGPDADRTTFWADR